MLKQVDGLLAASEPDVTRLSQLKLSLQEKPETLKLLDGEIVDLVEEEHVAEEIERADGFKQGIYSAMVRFDSKCLITPVIPSLTVSTVDTPHKLADSRASTTRFQW